MGACLSCLGLDRHSADDEPSETDRLLYEESSNTRNGYGAAGQAAHIAAPDPEELRRHREMLERICAETANNLIDVQHTNLLTLRGKPSAEFTKLLNTHFAVPEPDPQAELETPKTPVNNIPSSPPEPPSPFTQAQLQAAAQNGKASNAAVPTSFATISEHATSEPQTPQPRTPRRTPSQERGHEANNSSQHGGDDAPDQEDTAEQEWLAAIGAKDRDMATWDDIKRPTSSLIIDLGSDDTNGTKPK